MSEKDDDSLFSAPPAPENPRQEPTIYNFDIDLDDPTYVTKSTRVSPNWKTIGLISGGVILLAGLISLILLWVAPDLYKRPPIQAAIHFYEFLNEEDYSEACEIVEPGTISCLQLESQIKEIIKIFGGTDRVYEWDFVEMKYQATDVDTGVVHLKVDGYIRIIDSSTKRFMDLPYSTTMTMVKRNNHWYYRP
jgi:hypothetical protein